MTQTATRRFAARTFTTLTAATLAAGVLMTAFATPAEAGRRDRAAFFGSLAAGIIGGAIIANEASRARDHRYDRRTRWERHVDRCFARYASYDPETDTWIDHYGRERRCRL